jgi:methionyl aminopeptidase
VIHLKSAAEVEIIARAGSIVADTLNLVADQAVPGVTTADLDAAAESFILSHDGALPAFKGLYGFPATLCTSVGMEVVHGIPSPERPIDAGGILSVDVGVKYEGYFADAAMTVPVGEVDTETLRLLDVTRQSLAVGIAEARVGARIGDIGAAIQAYVEDSGFSVIRELVGHGVGISAHEEPQVPNYGKRGHGIRLKEGMVLAIEPMVNAGAREIRTLEDEWTVVTADGSMSAHFEHTVAITADGPRILTAQPVHSSAEEKS